MYCLCSSAVDAANLVIQEGWRNSTSHNKLKKPSLSWEYEWHAMVLYRDYFFPMPLMNYRFTCFRHRKPRWNVRHPWYWLSIYKQSFSRLAFAVAIGHEMRNTTTAAQFRDDILWLTINVMSNFMAVLTDIYCKQIVQCSIIADNCINNNNIVATKVYWWLKNNPKASDIYIYLYIYMEYI